MKKRVLAALLALVMLFGALPMSVFAEDLETGDEFSDTYEEPTAPTEPDDNDLKDTQQPQPDITDPTEFIGIKTVPVQCDNKAGHYMEYAIDGLIENKCAELVWSTGSKEATLKLYPEKIAKRFPPLKVRTLRSAPVSLLLRWRITAAGKSTGQSRLSMLLAPRRKFPTRQSL